MKSAVGEQHQSGIIAWLTGSVQALTGGTLRVLQGRPVDRSGAGADPVSGQEEAEPLDGGSLGHGEVPRPDVADEHRELRGSPRRIRRIPPRLDPVTIWADLFGALGGDAVELGQVDPGLRRPALRDAVRAARRRRQAEAGRAPDEHARDRGARRDQPRAARRRRWSTRPTTTRRAASTRPTTAASRTSRPTRRSRRWAS